MDNYYKGCPPKMSDGRFLTDYRTAGTREQYIKTINGFVRDDEYRMFLQTNADRIIDRERHYIKVKNSCPTLTCVHKYPTRVTNGELHDEMKLYNNVQLGRIKFNNPKYPRCNNYPDSYMTYTK